MTLDGVEQTQNVQVEPDPTVPNVVVSPEELKAIEKQQKVIDH